MEYLPVVLYVVFGETSNFSNFTVINDAFYEKKIIYKVYGEYNHDSCSTSSSFVSVSSAHFVLTLESSDLLLEVNIVSLLDLP